MDHTLLDVLSVWWIVVVIDLSVVYFFVNLTKDKKNRCKNILRSLTLGDML